MSLSGKRCFLFVQLYPFISTAKRIPEICYGKSYWILQLDSIHVVPTQPRVSWSDLECPGRWSNLTLKLKSEEMAIVIRPPEKHEIKQSQSLLL